MINMIVKVQKKNKINGELILDYYMIYRTNQESEKYTGSSVFDLPYEAYLFIIRCKDVKKYGNTIIYHHKNVTSFTCKRVRDFRERQIRLQEKELLKKGYTVTEYRDFNGALAIAYYKGEEYGKGKGKVINHRTEQLQTAGKDGKSKSGSFGKIPGNTSKRAKRWTTII